MSLQEILAPSGGKKDIKIFKDRPELPLEVTAVYVREQCQKIKEYEQVLQYLRSANYTQVLAPIDGNGREFWVQAITDVKEDIKINVGCDIYVEMSPEEARDWIEKTINDMKSSIEDAGGLLTGECGYKFTE